MDLLQRVYGSNDDNATFKAHCSVEAKKPKYANIPIEAKNLAELVAQSGDGLQKIAKNLYGTDKSYNFLFDTKSAEYKDYRKLVHHLKKYKEKSETQAEKYRDGDFNNIIHDNDIEQYAWQNVIKCKVNSVIDKRILKDGVEYLFSFRNIDNKWISGDTDNYVFKNLIFDYEEKLKLKKSQKFKTNNTIDHDKATLTEAEDIVLGAIKQNGVIFYLLKPSGTKIPHFITSSEAKSHYPNEVIKYLQARIEFN